MCSYNCRGWRSGLDFVLDCYLMCVVSKNTGYYLKIWELSMSFGVCGMDSSEVFSGRPSGGCGRKSLATCHWAPPNDFALYLLLNDCSTSCVYNNLFY